jgi:hypothetical protein
VREALRRCLVLLLAAAFVSGGVARCLAAPMPASSAKAVANHSTHAAHAGIDHSSHATHGTSSALLDNPQDNSGTPAHDGCASDKASCCVACFMFGVTASSDAVDLPSSRLTFASRNEDGSRNIVVIDPGIPKQLV